MHGKAQSMFDFPFPLRVIHITLLETIDNYPSIAGVGSAQQTTAIYAFLSIRDKISFKFANKKYLSINYCFYRKAANPY